MALRLLALDIHDAVCYTSGITRCVIRCGQPTGYREQCSGGIPMTEEVEVKVREIVENGKETGTSFVEALRKLLLAGIGAVALSRDETEAFVNRLVERGMEEFLNRLNIPSKRDIEDLSAKIAQLAARVEELRKQK